MPCSHWIVHKAAHYETKLYSAFMPCLHWIVHKAAHYETKLYSACKYVS
jgi:hypothetical protein